MKDYYFYLLGSASAAISFIEQLIPILQLIAIIVSLTLTLMGIIKHIIEKYKTNKEIDKEDFTKAKDTIVAISDNIQNLQEKINDIKKED